MSRHLASIVFHLKLRVASLRSGVADRNLRRLQLTSLAHNTVEYAVLVALSVYAFDIGGAAGVGVITVVRTLPALLSGPLVAVVTDRRSRSTVLAMGFLARTATAAALAYTISADSAATIVYVLAALDAVAASTFYPAYGALVPELARSASDLTTANALASATENLGTIIGPATAAAILLVAEPSWVFVVSATVLLGAAGLAGNLHSDRRPPSDRGTANAFVREFADGLKAIRRNPGTGLVIGTWAFESILVGVSEVLLVVVAFDLIDWGEAGVGWLNAVLGIGGLAGSIAMASLARNRPFGRYLALGVVVFGLGLAANGLLPVSAAVLIAHFTIGVAGAQVDIAAMTLVQRTVPEDELGRVLGAFEGVYWGALGVGAALASWGVVAFGVQAALIGSGVIGAVAGLAVLVKLQQVDAMVDVPDLRLDTLRRSPMFSALPVPTLERIARRLTQRTVVAGTEIISEGAAGNAVFVVESGEVTVVHDGQLVTTLGAGDVIGEIALLRHVQRTATVRTLTDVELYELDGKAFVEAVSGHAAASAEVDTLVDCRIGQLRRIRARTGR